MSPEKKARLTEAAAQVVLQASREGRLTTQEDVLEALAAGGSFHQTEGQADADDIRQTPTEEAAAAALAGVLAGHPGIASFQGLSGETLYHAPDLLSRTFARILDRKDSPLLLMAEEIRTNSRDYPRPVPVELFEAPPFDLAPEEIGHVLQAMATDPDYQDISFTTAPTGAVYLFSTLHLERGYAAFLALRAESLSANP